MVAAVVAVVLQSVVVHADTVWNSAWVDSIAASPEATPSLVSGPLTLGQALRLTSSHHPTLTAALWSGRADVERARDEAHWVNPMVEGSLENFGGGLGSSLEEATLQLGQSLGFGRRGAFARVASTLETRSRADLESQLVQVLRETVDAFLDAWVLERRVALLADAEAVGRTAIDAAHERTRIGAAPATEGLRAETEWAQRAAERRQAEAELAEARNTLARQWGERTASFDSLVLPSPAPVSTLSAESLDQQVDRHPDVRRAALDTLVAAARLHAASVQRIPELTLSGGVRYLKEIDETGFVASVSAPLPLWNSGRSLVAAAEAERRASVAREREVRQRVLGELAGAAERMAAAREALELAETRALPAARQAVEQLETGYRRGRFTYLDTVDGRRSLLDLRLLVLDTTRDYWRARLTLEGLTTGTSGKDRSP
jgi:cobalt-zinc-cadmium efflux system outer membrane protein